jgi:hypothetical protein
MTILFECIAIKWYDNLGEWSACKIEGPKTTGVQ